jgi:DNA-binding NarL/FixJ family response regulator
METISVILVEENYSFRKVLKKHLISLYNAQIVAEVSNIEELVLIPDFFKADIILLDLAMPEIIGISFAIKTIDEYKDLKIIAISHFNNSIYYENIKESGFAECIYKENFISEIGYKLTNVIENNNKTPIENILQKAE